jgi:hypothetical protein
VFQKIYTGNILRIGQNKSQNSYFSRTKDEDRKRAGGGPEGRLTRGWRTPLLAAPGGGEDPWWPFDAASPPIKSLRTKTVDQSAFFPEQFRSAATVEEKFWGTEVSVPAPCRDGEVPPEPSPSVSITVTAVSIDLTAISIAVAASDDDEGVVLPRGCGLYR